MNIVRVRVMNIVRARVRVRVRVRVLGLGIGLELGLLSKDHAIQNEARQTRDRGKTETR
jgi:hypothetical protein